MALHVIDGVSIFSQQNYPYCIKPVKLCSICKKLGHEESTCFLKDKALKEIKIEGEKKNV
jgi:hypothetical protein